MKGFLLPGAAPATMIIDESQVVTAGAYVIVRGRFLFQVGPARKGDCLGVVRLGGHREQGESSLECALREVREEASLGVSLLRSPTTYLLEEYEDGMHLTPALLQGLNPAAAPLLLHRRPPGQGGGWAVTYLAWSDGEPAPAAEARGLLALGHQDLLRLIRRPLSLRSYLESGGWAVLREDLPLDLPLEPFLHLRLLPRLIPLLL